MLQWREYFIPKTFSDLSQKNEKEKRNIVQLINQIELAKKFRVKEPKLWKPIDLNGLKSHT